MTVLGVVVGIVAGVGVPLALHRAPDWVTPAVLGPLVLWEAWDAGWWARGGVVVLAFMASVTAQAVTVQRKLIAAYRAERER